MAFVVGELLFRSLGETHPTNIASPKAAIKIRIISPPLKTWTVSPSIAMTQHKARSIEPGPAEHDYF